MDQTAQQMPCYFQMPAQSNVSTSTLPAPKLRSRPVCDILNQQIIAPVMNNQWSVSAFRMAWTKQAMPNEMLWQQIIMMRAELDNLVRTMPGTLFFVSAINATTNQSRQAGGSSSHKVLPGVVYWVVTQPPVLESRSLCNLMNTNHCGATLRLLLQPYQTAEKDVRNALFSGVKDNMEGCVRRLVEESCAHHYGPGARLYEPLVKVYVAHNGPRGMLEQAFSDLTAARFRSEIFDL